MAMVGVDGSSQFSVDSQPSVLLNGCSSSSSSSHSFSQLAWFRGWRPTSAQMNRVNSHSGFHHDDSTINIVVVVLVVVILIIIISSFYVLHFTMRIPQFHILPTSIIQCLSNYLYAPANKQQQS